MSGPAKHRHRRPGRTSAVLVVLFALLSAVDCLAQEAIVIVNSSVDLQSIELDRLRRIFKGQQKKLTGGDRVYHLIVPPKDYPEREAALRTLYEMDESLFFRYWKGQSSARPPKELSVREAIEEVGKSSRAIAVVGVGCPARKKTAAVGTQGEGAACEATVKLLDVDGRAVAVAGAKCRAAADASVTLMKDDLGRLGAHDGVKALMIGGLEPCGKGYRLRLTTETRGK